MQLLSYAYRFLSNFVFLALVYLALNFLENYQHRVVVAILVLVYAGIRTAVVPLLTAHRTAGAGSAAPGGGAGRGAEFDVDP